MQNKKLPNVRNSKWKELKIERIQNKKHSNHFLRNEFLMNRRTKFLAYLQLLPNESFTIFFNGSLSFRQM